MIYPLLLFYCDDLELESFSFVYSCFFLDL